MSNPAQPERPRSLLEASLALGDGPTLRQLREAITAPGPAAISQIAALAGQGERQRQSWNRFLAEAVRAQDTSRRLLRDTVMHQWGNAAAMRLLQSAAPTRRTLTTEDVVQVLRDMDAWRGMPPAQQLAAFTVVDETYGSAAVQDDEQVPDELVDEFEDTARTFLSSNAGLLPPKMQRTLFVYFCGLIVLVALMQASFTSDAVDAVLGKAADFAPFAGAAMLAAGKAFDRYTGNQNDEDDTDS
ncbi:hypothetical protein HZZ00_37690 (plasmid) [Streptomyces sp. NEAU-sy36]|uniref:hypothetical protein n=1 Tax=unclassified Streptomyces TaxID=2593676 RepID=UPI0015D59F2E|nr:MULTISPECIES: hypothetical protein [unclassified Streptomyces]QLJ06765.1 hypothetical protein HZZ00_37690 [Streptomyces sp. NEAU-sy36]